MRTLVAFGLGMDIFGAALLYRYGLPPRMRTPKKWEEEGLFVSSRLNRMIWTAVGSEAKPDDVHREYMDRWERKCQILSGVGIWLILVGFTIQLAGILLAE